MEKRRLLQKKESIQQHRIKPGSRPVYEGEGKKGVGRQEERRHRSIQRKDDIHVREKIGSKGKAPSQPLTKKKLTRQTSCKKEGQEMGRNHGRKRV